MTEEELEAVSALTGLPVWKGKLVRLQEYDTSEEPKCKPCTFYERDCPHRQKRASEISEVPEALDCYGGYFVEVKL